MTRLLPLLVMLVSTIATAQTKFPVHTSQNKRYLVDDSGKPFPILGRTAWCVLSQPDTGYRHFIENTLSHGYNAIEVAAIFHWPFTNHSPFNGNGDAPFTRRLDGNQWHGSLVYKDTLKEAPDYTTPNEHYWNFVDTFLNYCESKGIVVLLFPSYVGYEGGDQGWMQEMLANGTAKVKQYGAWIANRYRQQKNIVWMLLGDQGKFTPAQVEAEAALIEGLKSVISQQSVHYSAESFSGQNSVDQENFGREMNLNGVYTWDSVGIVTLGRKAYAHKPITPAFLLEEPYDEEGPDGTKYNPHATQPVRRFQWWGWLTTTGGYMAGNGYIYPFITPQWQQHLDSKGATDMAVLNKFIRSIGWWKLVPSGMDGMKELITEGQGSDTATNYIAAAASRNGELLVAYVPPSHGGTFAIDWSAVDKNARAWWLDPSNGKRQRINATGKQLTTPGTNASGFRDWVLLIQ